MSKKIYNVEYTVVVTVEAESADDALMMPLREQLADADITLNGVFDENFEEVDE